VFYSLLAVIVLVAVPYGTVEPWWRSLFQCLVFVLAACSIVGKLLVRDSIADRYSFSDYQLLWPVLALIAFAFLQTIPLTSVAGGINQRATLSADPFQTRQFIVQLFALLILSWLLLIHTSTRRRLSQLVELVVALATVIAIFGLCRQATQRGPGFLLPHLRAGYGYAQFINSNHFAFLMEMGLGLALGMVVCRGVKGKRLVIYLVAAAPMWVAVVLSNSRGGILSILCQVLFLALLSGFGREERGAGKSSGNFVGRLLRLSRSLAVRAVLIVALLAGAVTTILFVGGDPLAGRVDSLAVELDRTTADIYTLRPSIWRATWSLIKDQPVAGVGFGGYWIAITKYHAASGQTTPQEAHNDYLELLASGGVIGAAIGVWFVVALIATVRRKLRKTDSYQAAVTLSALAGILTVAVHSLVDFGLHVTINAVVFTVLISMVMIRVAPAEQET
jgi:O-antigen ligase